MKKISLLIFGFTFTVCIHSQYVLKEDYLSVVPESSVKNSFKYKKLALYPIYGGKKFMDANKNIGEYTSLEDALKHKKVEITESGNRGSGQVNQLYIENLSNDTIYLMAGEVVKGGKQDRVISDDMILLPRSGKVALPVFCVEQNRWSYKSDRNFSEVYAVSSNSVRKKASVDKVQGEVWLEVAKVTKANAAETSSGTYTALETSKSYNTEVNEYSNYFRKSFKNLSNCIGFVGVSGEKVIGCDMFASNKLFKQKIDNLLRAYITEAISHGSLVEIDYQQVLNYLNDFLSTENDQDEKIEEKGVQYKYKGKKVHINTY